jgi:UDP-glucose 4-epimerase
MDIASKRLMVIGGAGLVGSHIVDQLTREPVSEIIVYDNFVRGTLENLAEALKCPKVRVVQASMTDRETLRREMEAVEACLDLGVKRVVYSSSASVYGNAMFTPMTEEHPLNNRNTYGATKIANEQMFRAIYEQHKLPYVGYRYMNIYGPRMDYQGTYVSVIMKALDRIFADQSPIIYGDGTQMYDFIYVEDVAEANILGMKADCADEFFNIGMGIGTTINELVDMLLELTGSNLKPEYRPQAQSFVTHRIGSTEKTERMLSFKANTQLIEGLRRVVEWRKSQPMA